MKTFITLLLVVFTCAACKRTPMAQPAAPEPFKPAVRFVSYDGAPPKFAEITFHVISGGQSHFLRLGESIPNTKIRLSDFDPYTEELIVIDISTNQRARLSIRKPVNSPPVF